MDELKQEKMAQEKDLAVSGALPEKAEKDPALKRKLGLFLALVFGVAWLAMATGWIAGLRYGDYGFDLILTGMMFLPAVAALISRKAMGERISVAELGIRPNLKGNIRRYLFAYAFPTLFTVLTAVLFFCVFPGKYDAWGKTFIGILVDAGVTEEVASGMMYYQVLLAVLAGPLVNIVTAFTEMLGFQGYLLPKLARFFRRYAGLKASLVCGGLWSLWYLPLYADGYLYGKGYPGFPVLGMLLGFVFYGLLGTVLSYFTLKTGSMMPAALARGGVSAMAATALFFSTGETSLLVGPSVYGAFGCLALLVFALLYALRTLRMEREGTLYYQKNEGTSR